MKKDYIRAIEKMLLDMPEEWLKKLYLYLIGR